MAPLQTCPAGTPPWPHDQKGLQECLEREPVGLGRGLKRRFARTSGTMSVYSLRGAGRPASPERRLLRSIASRARASRRLASAGLRASGSFRPSSSRMGVRAGVIAPGPAWPPRRGVPANDGVLDTPVFHPKVSDEGMASSSQVLIPSAHTQGAGLHSEIGAPLRMVCSSMSLVLMQRVNCQTHQYRSGRDAKTVE